MLADASVRDTPPPSPTLSRYAHAHTGVAPTYARGQGEGERNYELYRTKQLVEPACVGPLCGTQTTARAESVTTKHANQRESEGERETGDPPRRKIVPYCSTRADAAKTEKEKK